MTQDIKRSLIQLRGQATGGRREASTERIEILETWHAEIVSTARGVW